MNTAKTKDSTCTCLQISNTVFFKSYTHQNCHEIQSKKPYPP